MNELPEQTISGLRNDKRDVYEALYTKNYASVERFILNNSGTISDAKDIFQDTLLVLVEKLRIDNFELTSSLKTYIIAISKNLWFKKLRDQPHHSQLELTEIHSHKFYCEISSSIEKEKTYWEKLQEYLSKITNHCNHLLHAMFFNNKNIEDIQNEYGYSSRHNAQNQKHKCLEQMRKLMEAHQKPQE